MSALIMQHCERFYTVKEVAKILQLHEKTVYEMIGAGMIKAVRTGVTGRGIRVPESAINDYKQEQWSA